MGIARDRPIFQKNGLGGPFSPESIGPDWNIGPSCKNSLCSNCSRVVQALNAITSKSTTVSVVLSSRSASEASDVVMLAC